MAGEFGLTASVASASAAISSRTTALCAAREGVTPAERSVTCHQYRRHVQRIQFRKSPHDRVPGIRFVVRRESVSVSEVGSRESARKNSPRASSQSTESRAPACAQAVANRECVCATPPIPRKGAIENQMRRQIRRRPQSSFDEFCRPDPTSHQISGFIVSYGTPLGLIDDQSRLLAIDSARISKGVQHQTAPHQFQIRFQHFFAEHFRIMCSSRGCRDSPQSRKHPAHGNRGGIRRPKSEVQIAIQAVEIFVDC